MNDFPNLTKLFEQATERPWHYDYDGPSLPIISAKPADGFIAFIRDADGSQNRADSNAKLLTVAANNFEAVVAGLTTVLDCLISADLLPAGHELVDEFRQLLAKIEREAGEK